LSKTKFWSRKPNFFNIKNLFFVANSNLSKKIEVLVKKLKFQPKLKFFLTKSRNFDQNSTEIFSQNRKFCQKRKFRQTSKFLSKKKFFVTNYNFGQKTTIWQYFNYFLGHHEITKIKKMFFRHMFFKNFQNSIKSSKSRFLEHFRSTQIERSLLLLEHLYSLGNFGHVPRSLWRVEMADSTNIIIMKNLRCIFI